MHSSISQYQLENYKLFEHLKKYFQFVLHRMSRDIYLTFSHQLIYILINFVFPWSTSQFHFFVVCSSHITLTQAVYILTPPTSYCFSTPNEFNIQTSSQDPLCFTPVKKFSCSAMPNLNQNQDRLLSSCLHTKPLSQSSQLLS